jgi:hypothetical protein
MPKIDDPAEVELPGDVLPVKMGIGSGAHSLERDPGDVVFMSSGANSAEDYTNDRRIKICTTKMLFAGERVFYYLFLCVSLCIDMLACWALYLSRSGMFVCPSHITVVIS